MQTWLFNKMRKIHQVLEIKVFRPVSNRNNISLTLMIVEEEITTEEDVAGVGSSSGTGTYRGSLPISGENSTGHVSSTTPASFASTLTQSSATRDISCKKESTFASSERDQQGLSLLISPTQQTPVFLPTSIPFVAPSVSADSIPGARVVQDCHCESTFRSTYEHGHVVHVGSVQDQLDPSIQSTNQITEISGGFQEDEALLERDFLLLCHLKQVH
ncbi:hypothetical protein V6N11_080437 [Hibiscus sabdariffa]|uniref:Uncharacterized protein n=1 Tax=Hibiscus sabdariffa TaxID=183260 RepID=A0ABR2R885_9ROSI